MSVLRYILDIRNLSAGTAEGKGILQGIDLKIGKGEIHVIMGPNGSGKSTLANCIMGNPDYLITGGDIIFDGKSLLQIPTDERSRKGIFMSFQHPPEIQGISTASFIRSALLARNNNRTLPEFTKELKEKSEILNIDESFLSRYEGLSGGEKKRIEILQMSMLKPKLVVLDEIDSGLDIDSLKLIAKFIGEREMTFLVISHNEKMLKYLKPDWVHIMSNGSISKSGGTEITKRLENEGYGWIGK